MPGVSKEQLERAREIDLLSYLQAHEPHELIRQGPGRYVTATHNSLVISNGKWRWNSQSIGGASALDYLMKVRGVGFVDAVEMLTGDSAPPTPVYRPPPPKPRTLYLPIALRYANNAVSYLQKRGIHPDIVRECLRSGLLYEARHNGMAVCVFVGKDDTGRERFGNMRGILSNLKEDAIGSDKRYSFCLPAKKPGSRHLAVFEAPIDALSHATIQLREGWAWDGHRLSLCGTSDVALMAFLERNPQITRVALCLDNDEPGQTAAKNIQATLSSDERFSKLRVSFNPPAAGNDYNEALLHAIKLEWEQKQPRRHEAAIYI
jgi:hypothetical protein